MTFRQFLSVVEIRTKVISVSTYLLATLYTAAAGYDVAAVPALLLAVTVLCVDMGTTAFNTFYDYVRGVDTPLLTVEPDKVLVHEGVAPAHVFLVSGALYLAAAVGGIAVAAMSSWWIIPAGIAGMVVGFLYNGGPLPISRTPVGELFAGGFLGTVLFLVVFGVHTGIVNGEAVRASLPSMFMIAAVLAVNNTCDIKGDRAAGRRTLAIVLGRRLSVVSIYLLCAAAYGFVALVGASIRAPLPAGSGVPVAIMPAAGAAVTLLLLVGMSRRGFSHATKHANMAAMVRIVVVFTAAYAGTLVPAL